MPETPKQPDFQTFIRVASVLNSSLELHAVLRELLAGLDSLLRPTHWSLLLEDERGDELVFTLVRGEARPKLIERRLARNEGIAGWVATHQQTLLLPDARTDPRFSPRMDALSGFTTRSIVAVPLRVQDRCIGVLELVNAMDERPFTETDVAVLKSYADFAAIAINNARTHAAIVELAKNDPLTQLRNSQYFIRCLDDAIAVGTAFAVVFFDMDRFKTLVDTYGHVHGSAALAELGRVLHDSLHPGEIGCRFGGDEFAILVPGADVTQAEARCDEIARVIEARTFLDDEGIRATLGASFGAASFPIDGRTAEQLLSIADKRMYRSKRARKRARE